VAVIAGAQLGSASSNHPATHRSPAKSVPRRADDAAATATCPPDATYPTNPLDQTQYGVPYTADFLDGTVNVGFNEDTGEAGTEPLRGTPYFPWMLHLTGLQGTVSGCVPLPGLSLTVQPGNVHVNTYGYMQGPNGCTTSARGCTLPTNRSATFSFTGIADPGETNLPIFLDGNSETAAGAATLHFQTSQLTNNQQISEPGLQVSDAKFTLKYPYPSPGPPKMVDLSADHAPGAKLAADIYAGQVSVKNTTASTVTSIAGEERAGFVTGPSTLAPGQSRTYTFTLENSSGGDLPDEQALPITFTGAGPTGTVRGFGVAYFNVPSLGITPLTITAATINGTPALTGLGPILSAGSVFTGTVTLANDSSTPVTGVTGETSQTAQLLVTIAGSGQQSPPLVLTGFSLKVAVRKPLSAVVVGARPDALGSTPSGALDATAGVSAFGAFSSTDPELACGEPVSTTLTTGTSTVVPVSPPGDRLHPNGPQWTLQGQPIAGALTGATGVLVSNSFALKIPAKTPPGYTFPCSFYGELFNWEIGGVKPDGKYYNCPKCGTYHSKGPADAGAAIGEAQVTIDALLTSVGALPVCKPSDITPTAC
jgi:hypothetical protein